MIRRKVCTSAVDHGTLFLDAIFQTEKVLFLKSTGDLNMAGLCVVLYYRCRTGSDESFHQSTDCRVSSSTFWGRIGTPGTPTEGYQEVERYGSVMWGPVPVLVHGNATKCVPY